MFLKILLQINEMRENLFKGNSIVKIVRCRESLIFHSLL